MSGQDSDSDADSLFGSPPPSPVPNLNRGGSPRLALPGSPGSICASLPKNVGTIALPGSHDISEYVVNLPASLPRPSPTPPTPPAQPAPRQFRFAEWVGPKATSLPPRDSRKTKPRKKKRKAKSAIPAPTVSISNTDEPLPPNFLRNQQALLGLAGLVGGVNPANLPTWNSRGATAENPIVVEEEAPSISGCAWGTFKPQAQIDMPNSQTIADMLVSQGNIFPVLRSLMPYFGVYANVGCCSRVHQQFRLQTPEQSTPIVTAPPLKKRKLNSVPAGAKDWDVPYPFPANEGPSNYLETWQKKRGKKLMMQLVSLVREAVQKAATKEDSSKSSEGATSSNSIRYNGASEAIDELGGGSTVASTPTSAIPLMSSTSEHEFAFPDFFAPESHGISNGSLFNADFDSLLGAVNETLNDPSVQLTGNDLAAMSSFGFSPSTSASPTLTSSTRLSTPCDFSWPHAVEGQGNDASPRIQDFNFDDIPIDPSLFDFSWSNFPTPELQKFQAEIPASTGFDGITNEYVPNLKFDDDLGITSSFDSVDTTANAVVPCSPFDTSVTESQTSTLPPTPTDPPTSFEISACLISRSEAPSQPISPALSPSTAGEPLTRDRGESRPSAKKLDREDTLRRARIRREQLAAEIARSKIELWETTIEQGVLTHLSRDEELLQKASG